MQGIEADKLPEACQKSDADILTVLWTILLTVELDRSSQSLQTPWQSTMGLSYPGRTRRQWQNQKQDWDFLKHSAFHHCHLPLPHLSLVNYPHAGVMRNSWTVDGLSGCYSSWEDIMSANWGLCWSNSCVTGLHAAAAISDSFWLWLNAPPPS